jgi:hypothetical protein
MRNTRAYRQRLRWVRRWRKNPENKAHERAMEKLRKGVRAGDIPLELYWREVKDPRKTTAGFPRFCAEGTR